MTDLNGFLPPLTPTGKSALVPEMPWFYSGTLLTVEYLTDPQNVRAILPPTSNSPTRILVPSQ